MHDRLQFAVDNQHVEKELDAIDQYLKRNNSPDACRSLRASHSAIP